MRSVASRVIAASALLAVIFIVAAVVAVEDQRAVAAGVGTMVTAVFLAAGLAAYLIRSVVLRGDELESQNAINAAVIDGVRDGIVLRDLEGRVLVANRTMDAFAREILEAEDGEHALELARRELPDLLFLDWTMPRLSGLDVCRQLREEPATAELRVVMLTARTQDFDRLAATAVGVDDYITKPFSPLRLLEKVRETLGPEALL